MSSTLFTKPTGESLEYQLTPADNWGALVSEVQETPNKLVIAYENIIFTWESSENSLKETWTIKNHNILTGNKILLEVDSTETPTPDAIAYDEALDEEHITCVNFGDHWRLEPLLLEDSLNPYGEDDERVFGRYEILADGNLYLHIPQTFADNCEGDLIIDPNVSALGSNLDHVPNEGMQHMTDNGTTFIICGKIGATGYILTTTTPLTPTYTNEYATSNFTASTQLQFCAALTLADGSFMFVFYDSAGGATTRYKYCTRAAGAATYSALTSTGIAANAIVPTFGFEAKVVGDGQSIAFDFFSGTTLNAALSPDSGANWALTSAPGLSVNGTTTRRAHGICAHTSDTDKLYLFAQTGNTGQPIYYKEYTISTNTWGSQLTAASNCYRNHDYPLFPRMDTDGKLHLSTIRRASGTDFSRRWYWSNYSGSWTSYDYSGAAGNHVSILDGAGNFGFLFGSPSTTWTIGAGAGEAGKVFFWNRGTSSWIAAETPGAGFATNVYGNSIVGWGNDFAWSENS